MTDLSEATEVSIAWLKQLRDMGVDTGAIVYTSILDVHIAAALRDARRAERERCAKVCDTAAAELPMNRQAQIYYPDAAARIRALGDEA